MYRKVLMPGLVLILVLSGANIGKVDSFSLGSEMVKCLQDPSCQQRSSPTIKNCMDLPGCKLSVVVECEQTPGCNPEIIRELYPAQGVRTPETVLETVRACEGPASFLAWKARQVIDPEADPRAYSVEIFQPTPTTIQPYGHPVAISYFYKCMALAGYPLNDK